MKNKDFVFTDKHHTKGGIISSLIAIPTMGCLIAGIILSFQDRGKSGSVVGLLGGLAFLFSIAGVIKGARSFKEEGFYRFSWIGTVCNTFVLLAMIAIIMIGVTM